jgi:hypothetical protein
LAIVRIGDSPTYMFNRCIFRMNVLNCRDEIADSAVSTAQNWPICVYVRPCAVQGQPINAKRLAFIMLPL